MVSDNPSGTPLVIDLYLDLMKRALTRTLFDPSSVPVAPSSAWKARAFGLLQRHVLDRAGLVVSRPWTAPPELREEGRDHPTDAETMVGLKRLDNIQYCVETAVRDGIPGDVLEAGVWRGGSAIFMKAVLNAYGVVDRRVWVCDSFEGLPPPNPDEFPADAGDTLWQLDDLAVSKEQVRANFERYRLLDDQVEFVQGLFQDTLPTAPVEQLAVLRADGDMYESTISILDNLYPKVSPGGFVIIDDYGCIPACKLAVDEYRRDHAIEDPIEVIDWTGVFWRKSG